MKSTGIMAWPKYPNRSFNRSQKIARDFVIKMFSRLKQGCLRIHENGECYSFGQAADKTDLVADVYLHHSQLFSAMVFGGSVGAAESYMLGHWSSPNLTAVMRLFARNIDTLDAIDSEQSFLNKGLLKIFHWFNRNTYAGSRKNISAHYDLGNEFFKLFLDNSMMYSAAIYPQPEASLAQAAEFKLQRVCEKLQLHAGDHLLEIGTGWGGLAIYAAKNYGCRVTTTTISRQQYEYSLERIKEVGLDDKITVLFDDYRELKGEYTKLVSIEMIEAVGHEHYAQYFSICSQLLVPNGLMLLQAITIKDQRYEQARRTVDFIQRYIFPGGSLPSVAVIADSIKCNTKLNIIHLEDIGEHYAQTLKHWRESFMDRLEEVRVQGFDEHFIRMWEFYFCYCEGGFAERSIGTAQVLLAKPDYRSPFFLARPS